MIRGLLRASVLVGVAMAIPFLTFAQGRSGARGLSLEMPDTLRFSTDEGTWMSLDATPDGGYIVFDLLGDLYRVPVGGGDAERITDGAGFDSQPRVSPDGTRVAFISDRDGADNIWISNLDGSAPKKLSSERQSAMVSPTWTPDSKYVIVTRVARGTELRMYHIDGGTGVTLDGGAGEERGAAGGAAARGPTRVGAAMSPDGRFLYFAQSVGTRGNPLPWWQIARRDMRSGDVDVITQAEGSAMRPQISPDGRLLVYATRHETQTGLRVRDLETGDDRWLVWPVQRDEQETGSPPSRDLFPGYAFAPDGSAIFVTGGGKILRVELASGARTEVPFSAAVELAVGPDLTVPYRLEQGPVRARLVQDHRLSPDGRRVVFSVLTKLYVMDLPDGRPRRLTASEDWEFKPTWSPNGETIAYVTWSMQGGHVWRVRADGRGAPERLTRHTAFYTDLVYWPDGERIVALRGNQYMRHQTFSEFGGLRIPLDLVWLPADGGDVRLVMPGRGVGEPHFAGDPDRIYVYSRDGLMSVRFDGTDRRTHLKVTGPRNPRSPQPPPAETILMRPDGAWALAKVANQLWVVAVPPVGGDAPTVSVRSPAVPAKQITDIGADYFAWADGGNTVTWAIGSTFYRRSFDSIDFRSTAADSASRSGADSASSDSAEAAPKAPQEEDETVEAVAVALDFSRAAPQGTIVLRGGTAITMNGEEVIEDADIVVTGNRIAAIGPRGRVDVPAGAHEVDVTGHFVSPGFVDTHAHWEFRTHDVLEPQNWSLVANLAYGVTAGLDVQTSTNDYFAYQDLVETGQSLGQRAFMTGPGIFSTNDFQSYEATHSYLRRYKDHYRTPNIKSYMVGNRQQRQWVVRAAKELQLMPTTEGGRDLKLDLTHAIDGFHGNEHTLPVVPLYRDVVELFARTKTAYTPTLLVLYGGPIAEEYFYTTTEVHDDPKLNRFYPHNILDQMSRRRRQWVRDDEHSFDEAAAQAAKIKRAGGLVGVGGHGQLQGLGYHWEMWALAMGGMSPREVLEAATIDGAKIIGIDQELGSLEAGKFADLVVLRANPLDEIRNTNTIRFVMKNGVLYDGDTANELWPEERTLEPFWWWSGDPARP